MAVFKAVSDFEEALHRSTRALVDQRPQMAWTAALLFFFGGTAAIAAAIFPLSPTEDIDMVFGVGLFAYCAAIAVWWSGWHIKPYAFACLMALGSLLVSAVVSTGTTNGGVMTAAFAYTWIAIYSAHFFTRRMVYAQATLITVGFGVGLLLSGLHDTLIRWSIVSFTVWSTSLVLNHLSEALRHQAGTDELTGLLNRTGFHEAAMRERAIAARTGAPITIALIDLDGFKQINDTRGHAVGDRLLADLGKAWKERLRAGDILGRRGGDEFVLLLPATSSTEAHQALKRLEVEELDVGWSVGVGEWRAQESLSDCIAHADGRLYDVKHSQRPNAAREAASLAPSTG